MTSKLFIGPVSKNVVDATIEFSRENNVLLGLIPSRRQIDYDGGYVNNWNTRTFSEYVFSKTEDRGCVLLQRDHGGIGQGKDSNSLSDISFCVDSVFFDLIHIDPFKELDLRDGIDYTIHWIKLLKNNRIKFEVGTEQAIRPFSISDLNHLLTQIKKAGFLSEVKYAVIQSGTSLLENQNTGKYDELILTEMVKVCDSFGVKSKEHNGDYLSSDLIHQKFKMGLDSINIAPEFGMMESECYINSIKIHCPDLLDVFHKICYDSGKWKKWVPKNFDHSDKEKLIKICGHYVLSTKEFQEKVQQKLPNIDNVIKTIIKTRIREICL